jgi:hypothetical protein
MCICYVTQTRRYVASTVSCTAGLLTMQRNSSWQIRGHGSETFRPVLEIRNIYKFVSVHLLLVEYLQFIRIKFVLVVFQNTLHPYRAKPVPFLTS